MDYCININHIIAFNFYIVSFTITVDIDGGNEITSVEVNNGEIVELTEAPEKEGYIFGCWLDGNVCKKTETMNCTAN